MVTAFSYGLAPQGPINGAMIDIAGANLPPLPLPRKLPHLTLDQICGAPLKPPRTRFPMRASQHPVGYCFRADDLLIVAQHRSPHLNKPQLRNNCRGCGLKAIAMAVMGSGQGFRNRRKSFCSPRFAATAASNGTQPPSQWESSFALSKRGRS